MPRRSRKGNRVSQRRSPLLRHRAVYELTLAKSVGSKSPTAAHGRIAFDFTGSASDGYVREFPAINRIAACGRSDPRVGHALSRMKMPTAGISISNCKRASITAPPNSCPAEGQEIGERSFVDQSHQTKTQQIRTRRGCRVSNRTFETYSIGGGSGRECPRGEGL